MLTINGKVDTKKLEKLAEKANKNINDKLPEITASGASSYADNAQKYIPPKINGWNKSIPAKAYKRQVYSIIDILRGKQAGFNHKKKQFARRLRQDKIKFVVKGKLHGKTHYWYAKTKSSAKQFTTIFNRGLLKVMFGAGLMQMNKVPKSIQKLLDKSPNLKKWVAILNPLRNSKKNQEATLQMSNKADGLSDQLTSRARRQGKYYCLNTMKVQARLIVENVVKIFKGH